MYIAPDSTPFVYTRSILDATCASEFVSSNSIALIAICSALSKSLMEDLAVYVFDNSTKVSGSFSKPCVNFLEISLLLCSYFDDIQ